jgi:hypothetical protein
MADDFTDSIVNTLMTEHKRICDDIRLIEAASDKILGFGLTVVGIGLTYGIEKQMREFVVFLPIALMGVFIYAARRADMVFWLGGYKRATEDAINFYVRRSVLQWEALMVTQRRRLNFGELGLALVYGGGLVASLAAGGNQVFRQYGVIWSAIFVGLVGGLLVILLLTVIQSGKAYARAYKFGTERIERRIFTRDIPNE